MAEAAWMGGRVVEGTGLENRRGGNVSVGSNPTPSATALKNKHFIATTQSHQSAARL
jgi:hypothetical protein